MSAHKQRYKNVGLDSNEMRRRREEEGIQLRKQKREQQLIKRRNVDTLQLMDNEIENTITVRHFFSEIILMDVTSNPIRNSRVSLLIREPYVGTFFFRDKK